MKQEKLLYALGNIREQYIEEMLNEPVSEVKRSTKKIWLIAAVIAAMVFLLGCTVTVLIRMNVREATGYTQNGETSKGEIVNFAEVRDVFIELGAYYPQEIPAGYDLTFVSEGAPFQNQSILYENEDGYRIEYHIFIGDPSSNVEVYDIVSKTEVDINGQKGILYEQKGNLRTLVWVNEKEGFGFSLSTADASVDLLAMARSTAEGEYLVPTRSEQTQKGIAELGDFSPEYLPDGFVEQAVQASPLSEGGGWYSYVRRWYVNRVENTRIYFEYETYRIATEDGYTDDAKTACSFYIPGYHILKEQVVGEEVEVNGMFGILADRHIAWADPEKHVVHHLFSEDVTRDELLKIAQSISVHP